MSGIGSIGSSQSLGNHLQARPDAATRPELSEEQRTQFNAQRDQHLAEALSSAGIDEETADAIKSELKAAFEESFSENSNRPDPEAAKEKVDSVFSKYGLEASEVLGKSGGKRAGGPPPGGPPPGGAPPSSSESDTQSTDTDDYESLFEIIQNLAEEESDPETLAQLVVDALYGLDKTV